jgi:CRP-like cAMP-binding protein
VVRGKDKKIEILRGVQTFRACNDKELRTIASIVDEHEAKTGDVLTREGRPGSEFFVVADGTATVSINEKKIATLGPGAFFGEMALLDHGPRAATVTADTPMRLYVVDASRFWDLIEGSPVVARKIIRGLAARLREVEAAPTY